MSDNKSKKKTALIIVLALCIVTCIAVIAVLMMPKPQPAAEETPKGVVGVIRDNWDPNVSRDQSDSGSKQSRSGTQIPGYSTAVMNEGDMSLKLSIGNPKENHVGFYAKLRLADGTVLYESPLLKPGQGLEEVPLTQTLKKGEYDAVVEYHCVLLEDGSTPVNSAESGFKLYVL